MIPSSYGGGGIVVNPLWDGLHGYWNADDNPNDSKGTYNGVLTNGATYGTGIINDGFSFDGVNDFVDMGDVLDFDGSTPFSISLWVYLSSVSGVQMLISKQSQAASKVGYSIFLSAGRFNFLLANYRTTNNILVNAVTTVPAINTWYNVVVTYDGSKNATGGGVIFSINSVNEVNINENNLTGSTSNSTSFNIGARDSTIYYTNGNIDEVGIWNRVLTSAEITELYNGGEGLQYIP